MKIPIPGLKKSVGLGAAVKKVTAAVGVKPCRSCEERAKKLDRKIQFKEWK